MTRTLSPDERVASIASRHHGLVTRAKARACGLSARQIGQRLASGRWERVGSGVYRISGAPGTDAQRAYAAVLSAGHGALVAGLSALALLAVGRAPTVPMITCPPTASGRTEGVRVRRSPVSPQDRTRVGPIPCTTPSRALLEAAAMVDSGSLERLVDEVLDRRLATPVAVLGSIRRAPTGSGRAGAPLLRSALEPWIGGIVPGSPAEARLIRRLSDWGLPAPTLQHEVPLSSGRRAFIDLAWPRWLVGLEYDGSATHAPRHLGADMAREDELRRRGWWIGRVDRHDLAPSSTRVRDELTARLHSVAA
jgi:very-short-patch-repair endonuclease